MSTGEKTFFVLMAALLLLTTSQYVGAQDAVIPGSNGGETDVGTNVMAASTIGSSYEWLFTTDDVGKVTNSVEFFSGYMVGPDGTIYVQKCLGGSGKSQGSELVAINSDGSLKWTSTVTSDGGLPPYDMVISPDGTIYCITLMPNADGSFGSYTQTFKIRSIYPENGSLKREFSPSWGLIYPNDRLEVNSLGQLIYTDVGINKIVALNPDATVAWTADIPSFDISVFRVGPADQICVYTRSNAIYLLGADGSMIWNATIDAKYSELECYHINIDDEGDVIVCLQQIDNSTILKYSPQGNLLWAYDLVGSELYGGSLICKDGSILECYSTYHFLVNNGAEHSWTTGTTSILCLTSDGQVKWDIEHEIGGMVITSDGIIYEMASSHYYAFDANGTTIWEQDQLHAPSPMETVWRPTDYTTGQVFLGADDRVYFGGVIVMQFGAQGYIMAIEGTPQIQDRGQAEWVTIPLIVNIILASVVILLFLIKRRMDKDGDDE